MSLQDAIVEGFLEHGVPRHAPGSAIAMGEVSARRWDSKTSEGGFASAGVVPALPKAFPDVAAYPAAQIRDASPFLGPAIVGPPAALIIAPCVAQLLAAHRLARIPFASHLVFEPRDGLGRCADEQGHGEDEAQELALPDPARAALLCVDLQPQMSADPLADVLQPPLGSVFAAHVNVSVIGIAVVLESSAFQFLVEFVQIDVGQQW